MSHNEFVQDRLQFAYWVPNVSGGLVISNIEQRTSFELDYNIKLAQTAERVGFDYALAQVRYLSSYGAAQQHESAAMSLALLLATERLNVINAVLPGQWEPTVLAKFILTADQFSNGRAAVNVVSGWFKDEFTRAGLPWLEHDERVRRAGEFIEVLRKLFTEENVSYRGDFYRLTDYSLRPGPVAREGRPYPPIFQGGNSTAARFNGGAFSDVYFSNGKDFDGFTEQYDEVTR
ncbi:MAG: LLM class flavin-dependent oxidoreductase, partial [Agromyces sp.]